MERMNLQDLKLVSFVTKVAPMKIVGGGTFRCNWVQAPPITIDCD